MPMAKKAEQEGRHIVARFLFTAYCLLMLWLLFGQRIGEELTPGSVNWIPFETIRLYLHMRESTNVYFARHAYVNLIGNVVMFIPLGVFLPWIWKRLRSFFKVLLLVLLMIVGIELLQYATGLGSCDIDDLLLNVPGAVIGYVFWRFVCRKST